MKLDHERFVLRPNRANRDGVIVDLSFANVFDRVWSDCRSWQLILRHACIMQNNPRIKCNDLFGRNNEAD